MNYTIEFNKLNSIEALEAVFDKINDGANVVVTEIPSTEAQAGTVILFSKPVIEVGQLVDLDGLSKAQKLTSLTQQLALVADGTSAIISLNDVEAHAVADRRGLENKDVAQLREGRNETIPLSVSASIPKVA